MTPKQWRRYRDLIGGHARKEVLAIIKQESLTDKADDDWGCDHCRNNGKLTSDGRCPECGAEFDIGEDELRN